VASVGNKTLATYFPNSLVTRNVMAGGSAGAYPSGNEFPTIADFQGHFVDYAGGNYALAANTNWQSAGTDGLDLGADLSKIAGAGSMLGAPSGPQAVIPPLTIETLVLPAATEGNSYSSTLAASGGVAPITWSVASGILPAGLLLDTASGGVTGTAVTAGDFGFTVQARDLAGTTASQALSIHVERAIPALAITTSALNTVTATLPFSQALAATGGLGTYRWTLAGNLPSGLSLSSVGVLAGTTSSAGRYPVTITAIDAQDASRSTSQAYSLYVAPPPNHPPTVTLSAPSNNLVVPVGSTLTLTANAADVDGNLSRIDLYVGSTLVASTAGPTISVPWMVATGGSYQFSAVATDAMGETAFTPPVTIATRSEIVMYAADAKKLVGNYQVVADTTAAGGSALWNSDLGVAKVAAAAASPASYAEFTFYAEAGRRYHVWIRGRAQKNSWANDSAYLQFSSVSAMRIGTTGSTTYNLEEASDAGLSNWGWQDNGWGTNVMGTDIVFEATGLQTLRIQSREDGLYIDQIVLSPQQYQATTPGALKNDTTIVNK